MLGTVDHTLTRQWINITNWIRLSADLSYTRETTSSPLTVPSQERYDANLFLMAKRQAFNGATFTNFWRVAEENKLERNLEVPFFLRGEVDRNTAWRATFIGHRNELFESVFGETTSDDDLFLDLQAETFRQRRFVVVPRLEAERSFGDLGEGYGVRLGAEAYSNRAYSPRFDLFGAWSLAHFGGEGSRLAAGGSRDVDYWETVLEGRVETPLGARSRTGLEQRFILGEGSIDSSVTSHIAPKGDTSLMGRNEGTVAREGSLFRSTTTWFGETTSLRRVRNRLEATYDLIAAEGENDDQTILDHRLDYSGRKVRIDLRSRFTHGETFGGTQTASTGVLGENAGSIGVAVNTLEHHGTLRYQAGRSLETLVDLDYEWRDLRDGGSTSRWYFRETTNYTLYTINGIVRRLAELRQELGYERFDAGPDRARSIDFALLGSYYPTKVLGLWARGRFRNVEPAGVNEYILGSGGGFSFEKLVLTAEYEFGYRTAGTGFAQREEHRWRMDLRKTF
jgi:hypothetical protein